MAWPYKQCKIRTQAADTQRHLIYIPLVCNFFFHQKKQILFSWTIGTWNSVSPSLPPCLVSLQKRKHRDSWSQAETWGNPTTAEQEGWPLSSACSAFEQINYLIPSIYLLIFIMLVSTQLSSKFLCFFQAWWSWSTDPEVIS